MLPQDPQRAQSDVVATADDGVGVRPAAQDLPRAVLTGLLVEPPATTCAGGPADAITARCPATGRRLHGSQRGPVIMAIRRRPERSRCVVDVSATATPSTSNEGTTELPMPIETTRPVSERGTASSIR